MEQQPLWSFDACHTFHIDIDAHLLREHPSPSFTDAPLACHDASQHESTVLLQPRGRERSVSPHSVLAAVFLGLVVVGVVTTGIYHSAVDGWA